MRLLSTKERLMPCCKAHRMNVTVDDEEQFPSSVGHPEEFPVYRKCPSCADEKWEIGADVAKGASDLVNEWVYKLRWRRREQKT